MASKVVLDAIEAQVTAEFSAAPVYMPNSIGSPAANLPAFVQIDFPVGMAEPLTLNGVDQEIGSVRFIVHAALQSGTDDALTYADDIADAFRQKYLESAGEIVQTGAPSSPVSLGDNGAYYRISLSVPFWRFHS